MAFIILRNLLKVTKQSVKDIDSPYDIKIYEQLVMENHNYESIVRFKALPTQISYLHNQKTDVYIPLSK